MKKIFLSLALLMGAVASQAQEYYMFDPADLDENGWLWFDSEAKADKYVGTCLEEDYKADPNGKLIQRVYADQVPSYPETTIDVEAIGYGTEGEIGADGYKTGAIILPAASANLSTNGGGIVICMPSCTTFSMNVSCEASVSAQLLSSTDASLPLSEYEVRKAYTIFNKFAGAGNVTKSGLESVTNGYNDTTIKGDRPVYVYFRNITNHEVYIHGIKVTCPRQEWAGIEDIAADSNATQKVYSVNGTCMGTTTKGLRAGVYAVKSGSSVKKVVIK